MNGPSYIVERWPNGWLICAPPDCEGIPLGALNECGALFPSDAKVDFLLRDKLNENGKRVVYCIGNVEGLARWREEILPSLADVAKKATP